ncbi:MAG: hypothetical protein DRP27_02500 [Thermotogae bacterium]|nr:MAG: hypothetical protein DRP27_02500 [Thermotogota bacterium]
MKMCGKTERFLGLLGLAKRAGKVVWGKDRLKKAIRSRRLRLLLLSSDIGETVERDLIYKAGRRKIYCVRLCGVTKEDLGQALGSPGGISAVGITDRKLAEKIMNVLPRGDEIGA